MVTNVPLWCGILIRGEGHACIWAGGIREISVPFPQSCCEPKNKPNQQAKNPKKKKYHWCPPASSKPYTYNDILAQEELIHKGSFR